MRLPLSLRAPATAALALALMAAGPAARAHDSWFQALPEVRGGALELAFGTGNRFPVREVATDERYLRTTACRAPDGRTVPLEAQRYDEDAIVLALSPGRAAAGAWTCWAQLVPLDLEIPDDATVSVYLDEIRAPAWAREAWAAQRAAGQPWKERYVKHARIELRRGRAGAAAKPARPAPLGLDAVIETGAPSPRAGAPTTFRVLRDGKPLKGQAVELVHEGAAPAQWHETDAQGRLRATLPAPGRWLLRGTELRRSVDDPGRWDSRFLTLAFDVAAPRAPKAP